MFDDFSKPKRYRVMAYRIGDNRIRLSVDPDRVEPECMKIIYGDLCHFDADSCENTNNQMIRDGVVLVVRGGYDPQEIVDYLMSYNQRDETQGMRKEALYTPTRGHVEIWVRDDSRLPLL